MSSKSAIIIGGGYGGLATACLLGKAGYKVYLLEKNEQLGGRASVLKVSKSSNGTWQEIIAPELNAIRSKNVNPTKNTHDSPEKFVFDMGPSWYLMPDVFEHFFKILGEDINKYLTLTKLSPSYRIFFKDVYENPIDIKSNLAQDTKTFNKISPSSGLILKEYLKKSSYIYKVATQKLLYKNYDSIKDFLDLSLIKEANKLSLFLNMDKYVKKYFASPELQKIMQYPLVFLGSSPYNAPAFYSLLSHVDFNQGVFYPNGGFGSLTKSLIKIASKYDVNIQTNANVTKIITKNSTAIGVVVNGKEIYANTVISNAEPRFTETALLKPIERDHTERYWKSRTLAPSALMIYLGIEGKIAQLTHHTLIFSRDWQKNFTEIFNKPKWPTDPSLYVSNPSKTDPSVAPKNYENLVLLVPIPAGIKYTNKTLNDYSDKILLTLEKVAKIPNLQSRIVYKKLFCVRDFKQRYNSYKGTGLGLAHTLKQTAFFRPKNFSKKVKNLYFVGANTHPGIGVPITLISAEMLAKRLNINK
jgi:phytoene desaturase